MPHRHRTAPLLAALVGSAAACFISVGPTAAEPAQPVAVVDHGDPLAWLDASQARANAAEALTARMVYRTYEAFLDDTQERFGTLLYRQGRSGEPTRFALELDGRRFDPDAETIEAIDRRLVYDGRYLLDVDRAGREATRRDLLGRPPAPAGGNDAGGPEVPLPLGLGGSALAERYHISFGEAETETARHLVLEPKPGLDADRLELWLDRTTALPVRGQTVTAEGDTTEVVLKNFQPVDAPPSAAFSTDLPADPAWRIQDVPFEG